MGIIIIIGEGKVGRSRIIITLCSVEKKIWQLMAKLGCEGNEEGDSSEEVLWDMQEDTTEV